MFFACGVHWVWLFGFLSIADDCVKQLFGLPYHFINGKTEIVGSLFFWAIIEYFIFFKKEKYIEVFNGYDLQIDNPEMKKRLVRARLFNCIVFALMFIGISICNYLNTH